MKPYEDLPLPFVAIPFVLALMLCVLMLPGCTHQPTQPTVTSGVASLPPQFIPVLQPCMKREQIPKPPATWMRKEYVSLDKLGTSAAADIKEMEAYIVVSQGRMLDCVRTLEEQEAEIKTKEATK